MSNVILNKILLEKFAEKLDDSILLSNLVSVFVLSLELKDLLVLILKRELLLYFRKTMK